MKRTIDILASASGLALLCPLFAIVAAMIKWHDGGSILFRQKRVGLHGEHFWILKFRTMVEDAERRGLQITTGTDNRVTPVGHWLRKLKIDEFPQLVNVMRGEMSLVGPRPEVPKYVAFYTPQQRKVLDYRPGITDPASLTYFAESTLLAQAADAEHLYLRRIMPEKLRINLAYAENATWLSDLKLILRTVMRIFWHTEAPQTEDVAASTDREAA